MRTHGAVFARGAAIQFMQANGLHSSVSLLLIAVLAVWCVGLFARGYWRPDEPREAALVDSMVDNPDRALPELGGRVFAEKPPLTYWLAARSVTAFGSSPAAARAPQLLYALVSFLAIVALGRATGGKAVAPLVGLVFATFELIYQTQIWLACDALLVAGVSIALLGMYRGLTAVQSQPRLRGYLLMHVGLTIAFFSKNFAAWLVPITAFVSFVLWERRPRELLRWELWAGSLIPIAGITGWVLHVAADPDGARELRALFWNNLMGRFASISSEARYTYSGGHRNSPGKYFIEMVAYLAPWTVVGFAAMHRAWSTMRRDAPQRSAWRFAICMSLPSLVILSAAASARGIYAAPTLIGIALLIGLWATDQDVVASRGTARIIAWSGAMVAALSAVLLAATLALMIAVDHRASIAAIVSIAATGIGVLAGLKFALSPDFISPVAALHRLGLAYALVLSIGLLQIFVTVNRWEDLASVAASIETAVQRQPLVLWHPDETTVAWTDLYFSQKPQRIWYLDEAGTRDDGATLAAYLDTRPGTHVLALAPQDRWGLSTWIKYLRNGSFAPTSADSPAFARFMRQTRLRVDKRLEQPGGRAYLLLSRPQAAIPVD